MRLLRNHPAQYHLSSGYQVGKHEGIVNRIPVVGFNALPAALKPAGRAHDSHGLIHDPLADAEVVIDPSLDFFVLGDLFGFETGADNDPTRTRPNFSGCARRIQEVSGTVLSFLSGLF